jgi:Ca2+-binding RTX toxin-like protein
MTNAITDAYINALLSDATYALDDQTPNGYSGGLLKDKLSPRMTESLAKYIADNFSVVTHIDTNDSWLSTDTGFDATVWKKITGDDAGKIYVSLNGTTPGHDMSSADLDLTLFNGAPARQIVDMINWWLRITTPSTLMVKQIGILIIPVSPADLFFTDYPVPGEGIVELLNSPSVTVNGHSLGGNLATSFTQLFNGSTTHIVAESTFNSAGFGLLSGALFSQLETLLGYSGGSSFANTNYFAMNGLSLTTRELFNNQIGERVALSQENSPTLVPNHYMYKITDLLALGNMLSTLDASLDFAMLNKIVDAGSNQTEASYESALDALRRMVGLYTDSTPIGDVDKSADSRVEYYKNIDALNNALATGSLKDFVNKFVVVTQDVYTQPGQSDYGQFLALYFLSPFALYGNESDLKNLNPDLYTLWSADKNLSAVERNNGAANFSDSWYADRTRMLNALNARNTADATVDHTNNPSTISYYEDLTNNIALTSLPRSAINPREETIIFGDRGGNTLYGSSTNDRLYGGKGGDELHGGVGNDLLEGNEGDDTLYADEGDYLRGGKGNDIFKIDAAKNFHITIEDSDNNTGKIIIDDLDLSTLTFTNISTTSQSNSTSGIAEFSQSATGLKLALSYDNVNSLATITYQNDQATGSIIIKGFNTDSNKFGINLQGNKTPVVPEQVSLYDVGTGDLGTYIGADNAVNPLFFSPSRFVTFSQLNSSDLGLVNAIATKFPNIETPIVFNAAHYTQNDYISSGHVSFDGANGNDVLNGKDWSGVKTDVLYGLNGDDIITGDGSTTDQSLGDADILIGGKGSDQLYGGGGDDILESTEALQYGDVSNQLTMGYDNSYDSFTEALYYNSKLQYFTNGRLYETGILLALENNDEKNYLDGGDGKDILAGASFDDTLLGGKGDDQIYGGAGRDLISGGDDSDTMFGDSDGAWWSADGSVSVATSGSVATFVAPDILPVGDYHNAYFFKDNNGHAELRYNNDLNNEAHQAEYNALFTDLIDGGAGDDIIHGEIGSDVINGGAGKDQLYGDRTYNSGTWSNLPDGQYQYLSAQYHGDDVINGGAGDDQIIGGGGNDVITGGDELAVGTAGNDVVYGDLGIGVYDIANIGKGETAITAAQSKWYGNDIIYAGAGNDLLVGEGGHDVIYGGADSDNLYGDWRLEQGVAQTDLDQYGGNDTLFGDDGSDWLFGGGGNDTLDGGRDSDTLEGGAGKDMLFGSFGNDTLDGGDGDDILDGGSGNNNLKGGQGNDTYVVNSGSSGTIEDGGGVDTLQLKGVTLAGLTMTSQGSDSQLSWGNQILKIINNGIDQFELDDGSVLSTTELARQLLTASLAVETNIPDSQITGSQRGDIIRSSGGSSFVAGGQGNDVVVLDNGSNIYQFDLGDGRDFIFDSGFTLNPNTLRFGEGITANDLQFSLMGDVLTIIVGDAANGDVLNISGFGRSGFKPFSKIEFADASQYALDDVVKNIIVNATAGDDLLTGTTLSDVLNGGDGKDILDGRSGNDILNGGAGNDTYLIYNGSDQDTIIDIDGETNSLKFTGITSLDNLTLQINGSDVIIGFRTNDARVLITNGLANLANWNLLATDGTVLGTAQMLLDNPPLSTNNIEVLEQRFLAKAQAWVENYYMDRGYEATGDGLFTYKSPYGNSSMIFNQWSSPEADKDNLVFDRWSYYGDPERDFSTSTSRTIVQNIQLGSQPGDEKTPAELSDYVKELLALWSDPYVWDANGKLKPGGAYSSGQIVTRDSLTDLLWHMEAFGSTSSTIGGIVQRTTQINDNTFGGERLAILNGGDGDQIFYADKVGAVNAGAGNDIIVNSPSNIYGGFVGPGQFLNGGDGNDTIIGSGGFDWLVGGNGVNFLSGGDANDTYFVDPDWTGTHIINEAVGGLTAVDQNLYGNVRAYDGQGNDIVLFGGNVTARDLSISNSTLDLSSLFRSTWNDYSGAVNILNLSWGTDSAVQIIIPKKYFDWSAEWENDSRKGYGGVESIQFSDGSQIKLLYDSAGNASYTIVDVGASPDNVAPAQPTAAFDSTGKIISGIAEAGSTVSVKNTNAVELGTIVVNAVTGTYSITLATALINSETLNVTAKDAAGNISVATVITAPFIDVIPPVQPTAVIDATGKVIFGIAEAGSTVIVSNASALELGTIVADATTGVYSITLVIALINSEVVNVTAKDAAGNISIATAITAPDTTAPLQPTAAFDMTGKIISGIAEAGSTVIVKNSNAQLGTVVADNMSGAYSITLLTALINKQAVTVTATDVTGNSSIAKTIVAPDLTAPTIPTAVFNSAGKIISGLAEKGSTISIKNANAVEIGSTIANATTGAYAITLDTALINNETVKITAKDDAGNISVARTIKAPDYVAPEQPTAAFSTTGKTITGIAELASKIFVYNSAFVQIGTATASATTGAYTVTLLTALMNNEVVSLIAKDTTGNMSVAKFITAPFVDVTPPAQPTAAFDTTGKIISGIAEAGSTVIIKKSTTQIGTAIADATTGAYSITLVTALLNNQLVTITAKDIAGNSSVATFINAPDTTAPGAPTAVFDAAGQIISGLAEKGSTVSIKNASAVEIGSMVANAATGVYAITLDTALINNEAVKITAKDLAGNISAARTIKAPDYVAPAQPTAAFSTTGKTITGIAELASKIFVYNAELVQIGTATASATTGAYTVTLLSALMNTEVVSVIAKDSTGNLSPVKFITAPDKTAPSQPTAIFDSTGKIITGIAEAGSTVIIKKSTTQIGTVLADDTTGAYSITLTTALLNNELVTIAAKDVAGNTSVAIAINAPDTTAPTIPTGAFDTAGKIISGVAEKGSSISIKNASAIEIGTMIANATTGAYAITLDTAFINKEILKVTATDVAGNISVARSVTAPDLIAPTSPTAMFSSTGKVITGTGEKSSRISVKNADNIEIGTVVANATTGNYSISLLTALTNKEVVSVTAKDAAGNFSSPTFATAPLIIAAVAASNNLKISAPSSTTAQADLLIHAMAAFAPPTAAQTKNLVGYYDNNQPMLVSHG